MLKEWIDRAIGFEAISDAGPGSTISVLSDDLNTPAVVADCIPGLIFRETTTGQIQ